MKRSIMVLILTLLGVMGGASAQLPAADNTPTGAAEVGYAVTLEGESYPYTLVRMNIPLGPPILGSDVYVLPEVGVYLMGEARFSARAQLLLDGPTNTLFIDVQSSPLLGTVGRAGVRFDW